jgi:predicted AAA+ superfamily ATPase
MQVCFELNEENKEREVSGLTKACRWLSIREGRILTSDDEKDFIIDGIKIIVLPVWKWLLQ